MLSLAVAIFLCPLCIMNDQREDVGKISKSAQAIGFLAVGRERK